MPIPVGAAPTIPEMACEVIVTEDDSVKVTPAPTYADDKCETGEQHVPTNP